MGVEIKHTMNHNTSAQCHTENGEVFMTDQSGNGHHLKQHTMKPLSQTYKELGIDFTFPIEIWGAWGNQTYYENSDGYWERFERDDNGYVTYHEDSDSYWEKYERDAKGRPTYHEDSNGFWCRWERDANGDVDYYEDSTGVKKGTPKSAKK